MIPKQKKRPAKFLTLHWDQETDEWTVNTTVSEESNPDLLGDPQSQLRVEPDNF